MMRVLHSHCLKFLVLHKRTRLKLPNSRDILSRDNLRITPARAAGAGKLLTSLKLPNSRKSAIFWLAFRIELQAPGAPGISSTARWRKSAIIYLREDLDTPGVRDYIYLDYRKKNEMPLLLLLIPLKLLLLLLVLQYLFP